MSGMANAVAAGNTFANAAVKTAESSEASLNSRFLKAQADVTNKVREL
jgi:hypothetical protein